MSSLHIPSFDVSHDYVFNSLFTILLHWERVQRYTLGYTETNLDHRFA